MGSGGLLLWVGLGLQAVAAVPQGSQAALRPAAQASYQTLLKEGIAKAQAGALAEAERAFRHALKLNPKSAGGHYNLGLVLLQKGSQEEALRELETAAHLAPDNADVQYNLGTALLESHRGPEAVAPLKKALALEPRVGTMIQLARASLASAQFREAIEVTDRLPPAYRDLPQVRRLRADAFVALKQFESAFSEAEAARKKEPRSADHLLFQAKLNQKAGNPRAALPLFEEAERLDPESAEIPYAAGLSHWVLEEHKEAAEKLKRAIEKRKDFDRACFLLGIVWLTDGHFDEAFQMLDRAVQLQPKNAFYRTIQGMGLIWQNRFAEAEKTLRAAVAINPNYALPHYHLGKALERLGKYAESAAELEKSLQLDPDLTEVLYRLGHVYTDLGRTEAAQAMFRRFREKRYSTPLSATDEIRQAVEENLKPQ